MTPTYHGFPDQGLSLLNVWNYRGLDKKRARIKEVYGLYWGLSGR